MNSCSWQLFRYSLPLKQTLRMLGHELQERSGLILRLQDESGNVGEGEIAPLPGMHPETLQLAEKQICNYLYSKKSNPGNSPDVIASFQNLSASVCFGLEMAQLTLKQSSRTKRFNNSKDTTRRDTKTAERNYLSSKSGNTSLKIPINGLTTGSGNELKQECQELKKNGFEAVKLKVGRLTVPEEVERVKLVRQILGDEFELRLDANRAWEWKEALQFANAVRECKIEYCEEPLRDFHRLKELHEQTGMPLALDETLWNVPAPETEFSAARISLSGIKTLILKPGILGGMEKTKSWVEYAKINAVDCVLSSCFESGLALNWIALMTGELFSAPAACGLDTSKWFLQDLIDPPFCIKQGSYLFPKHWPAANTDLLTLTAQSTWDYGT
ncbi:MAG: o-succinylbenzoate synthase [SAR324 cluster bacterium]|nr:o-succinylbenzoate synthase [SAR324 cluster bacterium]MBL7035993.1 o-succinylbenzoate synthase [SAR324 cluster bacterium]